MDELVGAKLDGIPIDGFEWEIDYYGLDGPLLSQFSSDSGRKYLFYWCDCNEERNRWMTFPVSENNRVRLISRKMTLREIVDFAVEDFVFFVETGSSGEIVEAMLVPAGNIPEDYLPDEDSYIDVDDPETVLGRNTASLIFDDNWEIEPMRDFVRLFKQAYDFTSSLNNSVIGSIAPLPFQGGFSAMHFFERIAGAVPRDKRLTTELIQFASPGIVKFGASGDEIKLLLDSLNHYKNNKKNIDKAYREIFGLIRNGGFNRMDPDTAKSLFAESDEMVGAAQDLIGVLGYEDQEARVAANRTKFEVIKIFMAQYTRLRDILKHISGEKITIARWEIMQRDITKQ